MSKRPDTPGFGAPRIEDAFATQYAIPLSHVLIAPVDYLLIKSMGTDGTTTDVLQRSSRSNLLSLLDDLEATLYADTVRSVRSETEWTNVNPAILTAAATRGLYVAARRVRYARDGTGLPMGYLENLAVPEGRDQFASLSSYRIVFDQNSPNSQIWVPTTNQVPPERFMGRRDFEPAQNR